MKWFLAPAAAAALFAGVAHATVNVNTAQQSELQRTKGLDKHKAKAIIEYRAAHGAIDTFEELEKVPGFTPGVVEKVKSQLAFSGPPYTPPSKPEPSSRKSREK